MAHRAKERCLYSFLMEIVKFIVDNGWMENTTVKEVGALRTTQKERNSVGGGIWALKMALSSILKRKYQRVSKQVQSYMNFLTDSQETFLKISNMGLENSTFLRKIRLLREFG